MPIRRTFKDGDDDYDDDEDVRYSVFPSFLPVPRAGFEFVEKEYRRRVQLAINRFFTSIKFRRCINLTDDLEKFVHYIYM